MFFHLDSVFPPESLDLTIPCFEAHTIRYGGVYTCTYIRCWNLRYVGNRKIYVYPADRYPGTVAAMIVSFCRCMNLPVDRTSEILVHAWLRTLKLRAVFSKGPVYQGPMRAGCPLLPAIPSSLCQLRHIYFSYLYINAYIQHTPYIRNLQYYITQSDFVQCICWVSIN